MICTLLEDDDINAVFASQKGVSFSVSKPYLKTLLFTLAIKVCASVVTICMQHISMCVFVHIYTCNVFTPVVTIVSQLFVHFLLSQFGAMS